MLKVFLARKWTKTFDVLILPMASKKIRTSKVIFDFRHSFWWSDFWPCFRRSDFWSFFWWSDFLSCFQQSDFWRSDHPKNIFDVLTLCRSDFRRSNPLLLKSTVFSLKSILPLLLIKVNLAFCISIRLWKCVSA
jgi:hypothetical protein